MGADLRVKGLRQAIPSKRGLASVGLGLLVSALCAACASSKATLAPSDFPPRPDRALQVELAFDAAADLDLHVTDPELETVYFGNTPSGNGGRLDRDVRCERTPELDTRRETVRFDAPLAGRYRVGVDHVKACRRFRKSADYTIRVIAPGLELERSGEAEPGRFDHIALEFDWPGAVDETDTAR